MRKGLIHLRRGAFFRLPGPGDEVAAGGQGFGVIGAQDPLLDGQQGSEPLPAPSRIPRRPGPVGEQAAGGQGVGVLGAQDLLVDGQQGGILVAGYGRIPRLPGPAGEVTEDCSLVQPKPSNWSGPHI